jgi:hypothetical protein
MLQETNWSRSSSSANLSVQTNREADARFCEGTGVNHAAVEFRMWGVSSK